LLYQRFKRASMRSAQHPRKLPASPVQPLPMVSGLMSLSGTASPAQPPGPEATRPVARWEVGLSRYMVSITRYLNSTRDLAAVLNGVGPRELPIVGTGSARHIGDALSLSDVDAEIAPTHMLRNFASSRKGNGSMHCLAGIASLSRTGSTAQSSRKLRASATKLTSFYPRIAFAAFRLGRKRRNRDASSSSSRDPRVATK
jgi:hypothetical protein